ncbi:Hypothetical predicted protein, partial [Olea europaea subsp. europaea]
MRRVTSLNYFTTPSKGFVKLSFDGASKGNSRLVGLGGIFGDFKSNTKLIYVEHCEVASNNERSYKARPPNCNQKGLQESFSGRGFEADNQH